MAQPTLASVHRPLGVEPAACAVIVVEVDGDVEPKPQHGSSGRSEEQLNGHQGDQAWKNKEKHFL